MKEIQIRPEEPNFENPDYLYKLAQVVIDKEYYKEPKNDINLDLVKIWYGQVYMELLKPYEVTPSTFTNYNYRLNSLEAEEYLNHDLLEKYMALSNKWFNLVPEILNERFQSIMDNEMDRLETFYRGERGLKVEQWESMKDAIQKSNGAIYERLETLPLLFLQALQLQYIFGIQTLPFDFGERITLMTNNLMLFSSTHEGGAQNYVLFKGFFKHPLQVTGKGKISDFCNFLNYIIDGENNNLRLQQICDNLIVQTINSIAYSKAIERNTENEQLRKALNLFQELVIDNQDFFPQIMEEYDTEEQWFKYGRDKFKTKVLSRKSISETIDRDDIKPKKEKTQMDEFYKFKQIKGILEEHFAKIRGTKNQPKNSIVDAGFIAN